MLFILIYVKVNFTNVVVYPSEKGFLVHIKEVEIISFPQNYFQVLRGVREVEESD